MRRWLILSIVGLAGVLASDSRASAYGYGPTVRPYYTSAAFPCVNPPGYYTNSYYYAWYYPWFANYNYSHGSFANWYQWGGYATYGGTCGFAGCGPNGCATGSSGSGYAAANAPIEGTVSITLPADARLLFNGTPAEGTGTTRSFRTPALVRGQEYAYDLTAEVTRDGAVRTVTERVIVRAGETTNVTLAADTVRAASK